MQLKRGYYFAIVFLITATALTIACFKINTPGLYYDEILFVNAALAGKGDIFIRYKLLGIPILLVDYTSALKAWIYYPLFSFFPINSWSVRLPAILLGLSGGVLLVMAIRRGFGTMAGIIGAALILLDPTLIMHSRLDWGPNALMFFLRGLMLFSFVNWTLTARPKWAWWTVIAMGIGIFDKLNFIWIGCAAVTATFIFYREQLKDFTRKYPRHARFLFGVTAIGLAASIIRAVSISENIHVAWGERISYAFFLIRLILCGGGALDFVSGDGMQLAQWIWPGYLLAGIAAIWGIPIIIKNSNTRRLFLWSIAFMVLLALAFIATKTATGSHHSCVLSGIWQIALAALLGTAWQNKAVYGKVFKILTVSACVLVMAAYIKANTICIEAFEKPANMNWDAGNRNAALFAKQFPDADYIAADWGLGLHIISVTKDQPYILDVWPMFGNEAQTEEVMTTLLRKDHDTYIYTHTLPFENAKGNRANLINAMKKLHIEGGIYKTYPNWQGRDYVEIWRIPAVSK